MKKYLFTMSAVAMLFATSCQNDLDMPQGAGETATVAFNISTPEIATRAYSDGQTATNLQYAVYDAAGNHLRELDGTATMENLRTTIDIKLTTGNTYNVIFWAAAEGAPYAFNSATKEVTVDYSDVTCNNEAYDAFYTLSTFQVKGAQTENVVLTRPFAQINIGTNDYEDSRKAGYVPTQSTVTVSDIYNVLNLWNGEVTGETSVTFKADAIDRNEDFPVPGYEYIAMNYVLVPKNKKTVEVTFGYGDDSYKTRTVGSVPVQRNFRTNIYGQLLTSDVDINVEIVPAYNEPAHGLAELQYAALNGGEVTLTDNVELTTPLEVYGKMTLNLNGHNIVNNTKSAVYGKGEGIIVYGDLTINGEGTVKGCTRALWARGGNGGAKITINGGTYEGAEDGYAEGGCSVVYASSGNTINIYGGSVQALAADESSYASDLYAALNVADNKGMINVYGGRFYKQNPAAPGTEPSAWNAAHPNGFVAEGHIVLKDGEWYTVVAGANVANANELNAALANGNVETISLISNIGYLSTENITINKDFEIFGNGNTITAGGASSLTPSIASMGNYSVKVNNVNVVGGFVGAYYGANISFNGGSLKFTDGMSGRNCFYAASNDGNMSVITITDADVNMANASGNSYLCAHGNAIIYVTGGNFYGKPVGSSHPYVKEAQIGTYTGQVIISGGTFNFDPTEWVAAGYKAVNNGSTWTVVAE